MKVTYHLASLFVLSAFLATAHASEHAPAGAWRGLVSGDAGKPPIATRLDFQPDRVNIIFDEPANCRLAASYLDNDASGYRYNVKVPINGGKFCDALYGKQLVVSRNADGTLKFALPVSQPKWTGTFKPVPSAP